VTVRPIRAIGDPVLRRPAGAVDPRALAGDRVQTLVDDLIETMRDAGGAGLAATQIGEPLRICVIEVRPGNVRYPYKPPIPLTVLVNPTVEPLGAETFANYEGCLSIPGLRGVVERFVVVRVTGSDRHGRPVDTVVRGLSAGTFQHETDHLQGRLFVDRVTDTTTLSTWDEFRRHHQDAFSARARALVDRFGS
jgi:peptide deformylase